MRATFLHHHMSLMRSIWCDGCAWLADGSGSLFWTTATVLICESTFADECLVRFGGALVSMFVAGV